LAGQKASFDSIDLEFFKPQINQAKKGASRFFARSPKPLLLPLAVTA
jgi:hypothetical protein